MKQSVIWFNDHHKTEILEACFTIPGHKKVVTGADNKGNNTFEYQYVIQDRVSNCGLYILKSFKPAIIQLNRKKLNLKLIASRACQTVG